ncbi:MAG: histidine phosphatase family protein [Clostridiales bacterium]|nr:histidine phosphatase family protein [Clostridiales bacterium]
MTVIYLTRHGSTKWNLEKRLQGQKDSELTEEGIKQAEALRNRLKNIDIDVIYSSPIKRAFRTATIAKGNKDIELIPCEELKELNFGEYEGFTEEELLNEGKGSEVSRIFSGEMDVRLPKGETLRELSKRVGEFIDNLLIKDEGKKILIVTHGAALKAILRHIQKTDEYPNFIMGQTTLTKINYINGVAEIEYINDGSHLKNTNKVGW